MRIKAVSCTRQTLSDVLDAINSVSLSECLCYGNATWHAVVKWFGSLVQRKEIDGSLVADLLNDEIVQSFISSSSNGIAADEFTMLHTSLKYAKLLLVLLDVGDAADGVSTAAILDTLRTRLVSCNRYVYMSMERVEKCLFIFSGMLGLLKNSLATSNACQTRAYKIVTEMHKETAGEIIELIVRRAKCSDEQVE